jgi:predicted phosphodiesterase
MKISIISDLHLTKNFDQKRYDILKNIIESSEQVIINGDFWDGYIIKFDDFLKSEWNKLFPLLLEKNTIYIYGNHDREIDCDERVSIFSKHALHKYEFISGGKKFIAKHGQELKPTTLDKYKFLRNHRILVKLLNIPHQIKENINAKFLNYKLYKKDSKKLKDNFISSNHNKDTIYILSHSHLPEIDLKNNYVNTGMMDFGMMSWVEIEEGDVRLRNLKL